MAGGRKVGKQNGGGNKKFKVFMKLTLESMPLFLACKNISDTKKI